MSQASIFEFVKYCNEKTSNINEYCILRELLKNMDHLHECSIEKIAYSANISTASVSRLINKIGFDSFADFKYQMEKSIQDISIHRRLNFMYQYNDSHENLIIEHIYQEMYKNIEHTKNSLNIKQLKEITHLLLNSHAVTFVGDSHELNILYTLQLELTIRYIPTYSFVRKDFEKQHFDQMDKNHTIVFINVFSKWYSQEQKELISIASSHGCKKIAFVQDHFLDSEEWNSIYTYEIPGSNNNGYHSLPLLNTILCELMYQEA